ncbi:alpha subunit [Chlorella sorokiniana]|uniref:Alpha subunit n=1 Tax=Chlorella sorokiniana TaxID=3076 RepID=A0A2P6TUE5_CHLSO|nr:alpha subunit [Chlorella sorokiniana]|eukprot:PRW57681.1 alpha subunit [Chlorella sorokiniana]
MPPAEQASPSAASCADHGSKASTTDGISCKAAGDAAARAGKWDAAAQAYSAALACLSDCGDDPHLHGALLGNRCLARLQLGEAAAALADARLAVRIRPRWGKAHLRLGQALQACGEAAAAAAAFQRAAELDPSLETAAASALAAAERDASRRRCALVLQARGGPLYDAAVRSQPLTVGRLSTQLIATGGTDGSARSALWRCQKLSAHSGLVSAVSFSPCGRLLASASGDGLCKLWDATSGSEVAEIAAASGPVNHCAFVQLPSPLGAFPPISNASSGGAASAAPQLVSQRLPSLLVTCHINQQRQEGRVLLWDAVARKHGWVDGKLCGPVASLDYFRGKVVAAEGWCSTQLAATDRDCVGICSSSGSGAAEDPAGGSSGAAALLATACTDGTVKLFDLQAIAALAASAVDSGSKAAKCATAPLWEVVLAESGEQQLALAGHSAAVRALRWLAPGRLLSAAEDGCARVWSVAP